MGPLFARRALGAGPRVTCVSVILAGLTGVAGCSTDREAGPGGRIESIFELVGPESPAVAARQMVDPFDPDRRFRGMSKIAAAPWGGEDVYVNVYAEAIKADSDAGVRGVAARALGMHGGPEHAPLIAELLLSPDKRVRLSAARALQRVHNTSVIPALTGVLLGRARPASDKPEPPRPLGTQDFELDKDVRAAAADALGQYADARVFDALLAGLEDDELVVADAARESLRTLTGGDRGYDAKAWRAWLDATASPFAGRSEYQYRAYSRERYTWEWLPFFPEPPNERPGTPTGADAVR